MLGLVVLFKGVSMIGGRECEYPKGTPRTQQPALVNLVLKALDSLLGNGHDLLSKQFPLEFACLP